MKSIDFVKLVADGVEYESEYDYKTYTRCAFCGEDMDNAEHEDDCPVVLAKLLLKENKA